MVLNSQENTIFSPRGVWVDANNKEFQHLKTNTEYSEPLINLPDIELISPFAKPTVPLSSNSSLQPLFLHIYSELSTYWIKNEEGLKVSTWIRLTRALHEGASEICPYIRQDLIWLQSSAASCYCLLSYFTFHIWLHIHHILGYQLKTFYHTLCAGCLNFENVSREVKYVCMHVFKMKMQIITPSLSLYFLKICFMCFISLIYVWMTS